MVDKLDSLKPKHGKEFKLDLRNRRIYEALEKIIKLQNSCMVYLTLVALTHQDNKYTVPCRQCWLNTALEFEEIGSLMRELVDDKSK